MSGIEDYTSFEEVRAALGVSDDELEDETLALPMYLDDLMESFYRCHPQFEAVWGALPSDETQYSPTQARLVRVSRLFATYSVARHVGTAMPMFAPRSIGDGKATMARFLDPYKDTLKRIETLFNQSSEDLAGIVDELLSETRVSRTRRAFIRVGLAVDPVTE